MASNKNRKSSAAERFAPPVKQQKPSSASQTPPKRYGLLALFLLISVGGTFLAIALRPSKPAPQYKAVTIRGGEYQHDATAFTQGLVWEDGVLWESTGREGKSSIRKVDMKTGEVLISKPLKDEYFGEGLALLNDKLYQLTWKNEKALVYDRDLNQIDEIPYKGQGWGLATDGKVLILSDGTSRIRFVDPDTFKTIRTITVLQPGGRKKTIYEIDPSSGDVTKTINLAGLWPVKDRPNGGVMNGIAFNGVTKKMLVTGKYCPKVFEVDLVKVKQ